MESDFPTGLREMLTRTRRPQFGSGENLRPQLVRQEAELGLQCTRWGAAVNTDQAVLPARPPLTLCYEA